MVAARRDFSIPAEANEHLRSDFFGDWQLDRVSGLFDGQLSSTVALHVGPQGLFIQVRATDRVTEIHVPFDGPVGEGRDEQGEFAVQALLEGEALVWELDQISDTGNERIRRVMRLNTNRSQLVAERVDLTVEGSPRTLRTEYWIRSSAF